MQQLDAFAVFQGHAQRQEQVPVVGPFAIAVELAGALVSQVGGIEQRGQWLAVTVGHAAEGRRDLTVVGLHTDLGPAVTVTLQALVQIVFGGLLQ